MWLDVEQQHQLHTAVMVYKVKPYLAPTYMTKLLSNVCDVNSYNTRASLSGDLSIPNTSLNTKKRTCQWRAAQKWNSLPVSLRGITSLVLIKSACAKFMV